MGTTRAWLALAALLPLAGVGCIATGDDGVAQTPAALGIGGIGGIGGGGGIGGIGPPLIPVYAATAFQASSATTSSVKLTWTEHGGNGETILYRQLYDLAGNLDGGPVAVHTWTALPAGPMAFTDANDIIIRAPLLLPGGIINRGPIQPDHMIGYQLVEVAAGYTSCQSVSGGYTCATSTTTAFTPGAVAYGVGRAQLRVHVAQATAGASNLHVRAELSAWNETWLDSTNNDFVAGSNITYDLTTDYLNTRSDVLDVDLWAPDADGICVDELQLKIDNTTTFHKSFATCQWVGLGGHEIFIPFTALRSSPEWQAYAPHAYVPGSPPVTFVGYNGEGLTSFLDAAVGSQLRDAMPTPQSGNDAKLGGKTTLTRTDGKHLHVHQHLVDIHVVWDNIDFGTVDADPSYDLVIHHADSACAGWCVRVENAQGNSSYYGWVDYILDVLSLGVVAEIHAAVNDNLENALTKYTTSLPGAPSGFGYCFVTSTPKPGDSTPVLTNFDDGTETHFDTGSLTVCSGPNVN
ncbi:MAG TPA: hypothetical protein VF334_06015 [Polyangia bacterium]